MKIKVGKETLKKVLKAMMRYRESDFSYDLRYKVDKLIEQDYKELEKKEYVKINDLLSKCKQKSSGPKSPFDYYEALPDNLKKKFQGKEVKFLIPELVLDERYYKGKNAPLQEGNIYLVGERSDGEPDLSGLIINVTGFEDLKEFRKHIEKELKEVLK